MAEILRFDENCGDACNLRVHSIIDDSPASMAPHPICTEAATPGPDGSMGGSTPGARPTVQSKPGGVPKPLPAIATAPPPAWCSLCRRLTPRTASTCHSLSGSADTQMMPHRVIAPISSDQCAMPIAG